MGAMAFAHHATVQQVAHERLRADQELVGQHVARTRLESPLGEQGAESPRHLRPDLQVVLEQHRLAVEREAVLGPSFERRDRLVDDLAEADAEVLERQIPLAVPMRMRDDPEAPRARVEERRLERGGGHRGASVGRATDSCPCACSPSATSTATCARPAAWRIGPARSTWSSRRVTSPPSTAGWK